MKKVVAPKGYFFLVTKDSDNGISVKLFKKLPSLNQEIGHVNLCWEYSGCYSTHSYLNAKFRNKGLGALMYAKAIQWGIEYGYRIKSSGGSSSEAQRVWRGSLLKRLFDIKVKPGRNYEDNSLNPNGDTFYPKEKKCHVLSKKANAKKRK